MLPRRISCLASTSSPVSGLVSRPCRLSVASFHSSPPRPARFKVTSGAKVIQGLKGRNNVRLRSLPSRQTLAGEYEGRKYVHPEFYERATKTKAQVKRTAEATANNLIMGVSGSQATPPRNPKPKRALSKAEGLQVPAKKDPSDFVFRPSPLTRSPPSASKFVAHPTLTHLPQAFTSPPVRDGLLESLREYLSVDNPNGAEQKLFRPTPIQRLVLGHFFDDPAQAAQVRPPAKGRLSPQQRKAITTPPTVTPRGMRRGSKTLLAAETGSGKTVAFALPIIDALKATEQDGQHVPNVPAENDVEPDFLNDESIPFGERAPGYALKPKRDKTVPPPKKTEPILQPRALILAPTHELARQIAQTVKVLSHNVKLRVACLSAGSGSGKDHGASKFHPQTDIVVGTIGRVRDLMGMSGLRDEDMEQRRKEMDNLAQIAHIKATTEALKSVSESSFDTTGKEPWVPDRRLTWAENLAEKARLEADGVVQKGLDPTKRPSWNPTVIAGRRRPPPAEVKEVHLGLSKLEWLAIDEADIVLNPDFIEHTQPVIDPLFKSVTPPHLILSTATIPETLATYVQQHHPQTTRLITPNLHRLPHNLAVSKVTWSGGNWKADVLLELRRSFVEDARDGKVDTQAIIFINKNIKADYMGEYLTEHGIKNLVMTADSPMRGRGSNRHLAGFLASPTATQKAKIKPVDQASAPVPWNKPEAPPRVLVTTGMLSRGLDFAPTISTVVMCDEPRNAVDFIHRAGRVGRAGHKGRVVIFTKENLKPVIRHGGGAGRGGAIYKTIVEARKRLQDKAGSKKGSSIGARTKKRTIKSISRR